MGGLARLESKSYTVTEEKTFVELRERKCPPMRWLAAVIIIHKWMGLHERGRGESQTCGGQRKVTPRSNGKKKSPEQAN